MLFAKFTLNCKCDTTELEQELVIEKIQAETCLQTFITGS